MRTTSQIQIGIFNKKKAVMHKMINKLVFD